MKKTLVLTILMMLSIICMGQTKVVSQKEVYGKIVNAGIAHPEIVLKQAIVESANFKYKRAIQQNNYLGLLKNGKLIKFNTLDAGLIYYRDRVQSRYKGGDYKRFLKRIGYAKDPKYIRKLDNTKLDFVIE